MKKKPIQSIALVFFALLSACDTSYFEEKEIEDLDLNLKIKLPIGSVTYTMSELLRELEIDDFEEDANNNLFFVHRDTLSKENETIIDTSIPEIAVSQSMQINEVDFPADISFPYPAPSIGFEPTVSDTLVHPLEIDQKLTAANFDGGKVTLEFSGSGDFTADITVKIPSLINKTNNATYSSTLNFPLDDEILINLEDYNADFTHDGVTNEATTNRFVVQLTTTFAYAFGDQIRESDRISCTTTLSNPSTEVVFGDFEQKNFALDTQTIDLDFFENLSQGNLHLANPTLKLKTTSDLGFPIGIDLSTVVAKNGSTSQTLSYEGEGTPKQANLWIVQGVAAYQGAAQISESTLDTDNSNIDALLNLKPTEIEFKLEGRLNPENQTPNENFYVQNSGDLNVALEVKIPLQLSLEDLVFEETFEDLDTGEIDQINGLKIFLNIENGLPISGEFEIECFDANAQEISLSDQGPFNFGAATVDLDGNSSGANATTIELNLSESDMDQLKNVDKIHTKITLNTPSNTQPVNLIGTNSIVASLYSTININTNELQNNEN